MTVQEIHRYIWDAVIGYIDKHKEDLTDDTIRASRTINLVKVQATDALYNEGKIDLRAHRMLCNQCSCVLCVLYRVCEACPLYEQQRHKCSSFKSDYSKVLDKYDQEAALKIRNIDVLSGDNPNEVAVEMLEGLYDSTGNS